MTLFIVPLTMIDDNPHQARENYGDIAGLAARILAAAEQYPKTGGLMQPPIGRLVDAETGDPVALYDRAELLESSKTADIWPNFAGGPEWDHIRLQLHFGHRRFRAFAHLAETGHLKYSAIPVNIVDATDAQMIDAVADENARRQDLSGYEQARLIENALKLLGLSQKELAKRWGTTRSTLANTLRLAQLPPDLAAANVAGHITGRQALALLKAYELHQKLDVIDPGDRVTVGWLEGIPDHGIDNTYGGLMTPPNFIKWAIDYHANGGEAIPAKSLAHYVAQTSQAVGQTLPGGIKILQAIPQAEIVQSSCKRCPARLVDQCINAVCLQAKKLQFAANVAKKASKRLGVEFSSYPAHFHYLGNNNGPEQLANAFNVGTCPIL